MARRFVRVNIAGALDELQNVQRAAETANEELQRELAFAGRDKMRELIETRGTGRTWNRPYRAKEDPPTGSYRSGSIPGRVNTGRMRDAVRVRFEGGKTKRISSFGWIDAPSDDEKYFLFQEYGFRHVFAGRMVEGMFALRDARLYVVNKVLPRLIRKYQKRISRGVVS